MMRDHVVLDLVRQHGTPASFLDDADLRSRCRHYREAFGGALVLYASKAFLSTGVARWIEEEGLRLAALEGEHRPSKVVCVFRRRRGVDSCACAQQRHRGMRLFGVLRAVIDARPRASGSSGMKGWGGISAPELPDGHDAWVMVSVIEGDGQGAERREHRRLRLPRGSARQFPLSSHTRSQAIGFHAPLTESGMLERAHSHSPVVEGKAASLGARIPATTTVRLES
jgi:hypothetical protein